MTKNKSKGARREHRVRVAFPTRCRNFDNKLAVELRAVGNRKGAEPRQQNAHLPSSVCHLHGLERVQSVLEAIGVLHILPRSYMHNLHEL